MGLCAALHTFVVQQSHQCLSWFTAFNIFKKVKIVRASFAFFKFLFSPLNFMFTFGMSGFVAFPYLDKCSIPQRGEGRNIVVALLIFPLSHTGGFQTHPDFFFCSGTHLLCGFPIQVFLGFGILRGFFYSL